MKLNPKDAADAAFMRKTRDPATGMTLMQLHEKSLKSKGTRKNTPTKKSDLVQEQKLNAMGSRRTWIDGQWFDSKYEGECWLILKDLQRVGFIEDLTRERLYTHFEFIYNNIRIAQAKLDFAFTIVKTKQRVLADAKSPRTVDAQRFVWQCRMMLAWHDIKVMVFLQNTTVIKDEIQKRIDEYDENNSVQPKK